MMFGDCGHAIIMVSFGAYLVLAEKKLMAKKIDSEIFTIFFAGRYIILLMGIFSLYTGFVYNDIFSKSMNLFGSSWFNDFNTSTVLTTSDLEFDPGQHYTGTPYFIGLDPAWQVRLLLVVFFGTADLLKTWKKAIFWWNPLFFQNGDQIRKLVIQCRGRCQFLIFWPWRIDWSNRQLHLIHISAASQT